MVPSAFSGIDEFPFYQLSYFWVKRISFFFGVALPLTLTHLPSGSLTHWTLHGCKAFKMNMNMYFTRGIHCSLSFSLPTFILCLSYSDSWDFIFSPHSLSSLLVAYIKNRKKIKTQKTRTSQTNLQILNFWIRWNP